MDIDVTELENEVAGLMRSAQGDDPAAHRRLLSMLATLLRRWILHELAQQGHGIAEAEDIVQETLLAIHLKRRSWNPHRPIMPWLWAVTRHKLIDNSRRRGHRIFVPLDEIVKSVTAPEPPENLSAEVLERHLAILSAGQKQVTRAISIDGLSIGATAEKLTLSEGAVRVALYRALMVLTRTARGRRF